VREQKRRNLEKRRLELESKEIELEEKQLIRRKQLLLRKHADPHLKRRFPAFTAGRADTDSEEESGSGEEFGSMGSDEYDHERPHSDGVQDDAQRTLKALTSKLSALENELESIKTKKSQSNSTANSPEKARKRGIEEDAENIAGMANGGDLDLDDFNVDRIEKTLEAASAKRAGKTVHLTMPSMPPLPALSTTASTVTSQPPQLSELTTAGELHTAQSVPLRTHRTLPAETASGGSLNVSSLMSTMMKIVKEMQIEKAENKEFRSLILTSANGQNTQILQLLSHSAAQQKEIEALRESVATLSDKVEKLESVGSVRNAPKWTKPTPKHATNSMSSMAKGGLDGHHEIAMSDIRDAIEESRPRQPPSAYPSNRTQTLLQNADWKSISNVLTPKHDTFQNSEVPEHPYTVQRHNAAPKTRPKRSFLPSAQAPPSVTTQSLLTQ